MVTIRGLKIEILSRTEQDGVSYNVENKKELQK